MSDEEAGTLVPGRDWDIAVWLRELGLERYAPAFLDAEVTPETLPELTDADLRELGLPLGPRKVVLKAIRGLAGPTAVEAARPGAGSGIPVTSQAERRQLTLLFADLVSSTALSGRLDPEEMGAVLRSYQDAAAGAVARYGGHVAKLMGDGVLAYFGWPQAHEDEAERAVRAGLGIVEAVPRLATPAGVPLAARVGIATGLVVVGNLVGEGGAQEEAAVGETPNLAARLQEAAGPGAVVVADGTRRLLAEVFELRALGPIRLKGFEQPVPCFEVAGERRTESRFEARRSDRVAPMVGREQELGLVLERWHQALAGEGQAVLLVGEAGIGKSRLVRAVLDALEGEPHTTLRYQCSPHHTGTALWPVARQLGLAAGLAPGDSDPARLDNLEALLRQGAEDPGEAVPLVAALLGIEAGARHPALELTPQQQRARTLAVLVAQLLGLARHRPVLMVLEDAHWADPTTLELVGQALDQIADARVLMLLTSRTDDQPSLGGHPHVTRLTLNRLGRGPTEAIAARLAGEQGLPAAVLGEIAARADGVPLFVEELTKAVLDTGAAAVIPASLHDSLVARLDRVPGVREVAQAAACLGREFTYPLLAAVSLLPEPELRVALDRLVAAELVFARGEPPEASYAFKHALVRDAAHESLLRGRRRELHARIVRVLEERFSGAADAEPELLARHCAEAGLAERAARHWLRAAELAIGRSANLEAVAHCEMAEAQLRALPSGLERARLELEVLLAKAVAVRAGRGFSAPETEQVFSKACDLCEELGEKIRLMHALRGLFGFYYVTGRWREAGRVAGRLRSEAEGLEDRVALTMRWYLDGVARLFRGEPGEAALRLREALRHCPEGDRDTHIRQGGMDTTTSIRSHLAIAEWLVGLPGGAVGTSGEALEIARRIAHPLSLSQALALGALLRVISRDWTVAEALAIETRETGARYAIPVYVAFGELMAGVATAMKGNATSGVPLARDGMARLRQTGWQCGVPVLLAHLASSLMAGGDTDAALEAAGEALRMARANGEFCWEAEALRVLAEAKRAAGAEVGEVEAELLAAVDVARQHGARSFELRAATSLARLWRGRGRWSEARHVLTLAYGRFTEGLDTPDLIEARALLDTS